MFPMPTSENCVIFESHKFRRGISQSMGTDQDFHGISTLIITDFPHGQNQASGFFYQQLGPKDPSAPMPQWRSVDGIWLVTNRHVVLGNVNGREVLPELLTFHMRRSFGTKVVWEPIVLNREDLQQRARFHPNVMVDVATVEVHDLFVERIMTNSGFLGWYGVHEEMFPGSNNIFVEVADDAVVIGYPKGFYDNFNLFPIIKSGIIASRWGGFFDGKPYFLIDAKLFPGSSGSVVVSKPKDMVISDGRPLYCKEKQFAFLGVYSGEPYMQGAPTELGDLIIAHKSSFNLGIVWYGHLVKDIIVQGVPFHDSSVAINNQTA
jgi:hypothetical protein